MKSSNSSDPESSEKRKGRHKSTQPVIYEQQVKEKSRRKVQARAEGDRSIWSGLGLFGMVGWSVTMPTLAGVALGMWIDRRFPSSYSWTLMGLFVGIVLGCWSAWYWMQREQQR
ncbi:AtpZ/AtpI family protein [Geitlerinema sp. PCC 7407]|uniref:AtpZ/AtpI family protein n=1 Tax=Geitlerinema sp. PCC 7407 TaxID=1173025 RepID=UPI00029FC965|nr:AtpZ/AtpI family protein [Geitlerinema sp. PCC 7407]AFY66328.1 F0F1-ATPase subunit [Geitlerinema sp. PCC 7407]